MKNPDCFLTKMHLAAACLFFHRASLRKVCAVTSATFSFRRAKRRCHAVHPVALWTQMLSQVWACVKYVPKQFILEHFEHERYHRIEHV